MRLANGDEVEQFITHPLQRQVLRPGPLFTKYGHFGQSGLRDLDWTISELGLENNLTTWEEFLVQSKPWGFE